MMSIFSAVRFGSAPVGVEQRAAVGLGFGLGAAVGGSHARFDAFGHEAFGLFDEGLDHLGLGHDADDLAADEEVPLLLARRDADVGLARFAGTVDDAAHHRDLDRQVQLLERLLGLLRHGDHVDLGPATRGAGDEVEALALAQPERLEQLAPRFRFFDGVGRERIPDRVADPFGQQRADAGRPLDQAGGRRSGLGHAEVQRVVEGLRRQPVGGDHEGDRRGLHRDLDVGEVDLLEVARARSGPTRRAPRVWRRRTSCRGRGGASPRSHRCGWERRGRGPRRRPA